MADRACEVQQDVFETSRIIIHILFCLCRTGIAMWESVFWLRDDLCKTLETFFSEGCRQREYLNVWRSFFAHWRYFKPKMSKSPNFCFLPEGCNYELPQKGFHWRIAMRNSKNFNWIFSKTVFHIAAYLYSYYCMYRKCLDDLNVKGDCLFMSWG